MKIILRTFLLVFLLLSSSAAFSDINTDSNKFFNWLEHVFSDSGLLPPTHTQYIDDWCIRAYPNADPAQSIYAGVICGNESAPFFGDAYALLGSELIELGPIAQFSAEYKNMSSADGNNGNDDSSPGNGNCVNIPFKARAGKTETHLMTASSSQGNFSFTKTHKHLSVTDTTSVSEVTIDMGGFGDSEATLTETYQIKDNFLWPSANTSVSTTTTFGTSSTIKASVKFSPPYKASPVNKFCEGQTWTTSAYTEISTETITTFGFSSDLGSGSEPIPGYRGTVTSVNKSVTVPAGTFNTVQMDYKMTNGFSMTIWLSTDIGAFIKMKLEGTTDGEKITSISELTSLK